MHAKRICHRDLKLENIMLCEPYGRADEYRRPRIKLIDFGLSKRLAPPRPLTACSSLAAASPGSAARRAQALRIAAASFAAPPPHASASSSSDDAASLWAPASPTRALSDSASCLQLRARGREADANKAAADGRAAAPTPPSVLLSQLRGFAPHERAFAAAALIGAGAGVRRFNTTVGASCARTHDHAHRCRRASVTHPPAHT
jgi:serine/threonine protein kinase